MWGAECAKYMVINKSFVNFLDELRHPHLLLVGGSPDELQGVYRLRLTAERQILLVKLEDELAGGERSGLAETEGFLHFGF